MFETAELGQKVAKREFARRELILWEELLEVQRELRDVAEFPVIIDFAGVHGAGKGTTINLLNKWMDPRWIVTRAYGERTQVEKERPEFWRFWRDLPQKGEIALHLSGRYSRPMLDYVYERINAARFDEHLARINAFERTLTDDGALIIKFWMHLGRNAQKTRLKSLEKDPLKSWRVTKQDWEHWEMYDKFIAAAELLIARTNTGHGPWHIIEGQDRNYRSLRVGELVRDAVRSHLEKVRIDREMRDQLRERQQNGDSPPGITNDAENGTSTVTILDSLDMSKSLDKREYKSRIKELSGRINKLHRKAQKTGRASILVFEGPDAAGKGGVIRRLVSALDARNYNVVGVAAPTDEEAARNYLWRFWRRVPRAGRMMVFDRSWYGRVLVERVEGFASADEWGRAYAEICEFEKQLIDHGTVLIKFWINITKEEQLRRFEAREVTAHKRWKLTDEDWRNREQWHNYALAAHDMIQKTSTTAAPWNIVEGDNKLYARTKTIELVCDQLEAALQAD
jgi:polyphosphate:AMP phosphotransferase